MKKIFSRAVIGVAAIALTLSSAEGIFASISSPVVGGTVYSSGYNESGVLGIGKGQFLTTAQQFNLPAGLTVKNVIQAGNEIIIHASDDQVYSVGSNMEAQLGVGHRNMVTTPTRFILPVGITAASVHAYAKDSYDVMANVFVIGSNGKVYGAGALGYGALGSGPYTDTFQMTPAEFILPAGITAVDMQPYNEVVYVLGSDGNIYGAGDNASGELGDGTVVQQSTPVRFQLPVGVTAVELPEFEGMYNNHWCVLASDVKVYCSGSNFGGQLGDGTTVSKSTPVQFQLPVGVDPTRVILGDGYTSVVGSDGQLYSAGYNDGFGNGSTANASVPVKFQLPAGLTVSEVYLPRWSSVIMVRASDGQVYGAGRHQGSLGTGDTLEVLTPVMFPLPAGVNAVDVIADYNMSWVLGSDGSVYGSGSNSEGQLGVGNTTTQLTPVRYDLPAGLVVAEMAVTSRDYFYSFHVRTTDGRVFGSGMNADSGALGDGTLNPGLLPTEMILPVGVIPKKLHVYRDDSSSTCVQSMDDQMYCAGHNIYGQLGTQTETSYPTEPKPFELPAGVAAVDVFHTHSKTQYVLATDGNLYGAGSNSSGQLGTGDTVSRYDPVRFGLPVGVRAVDAATLYSSGSGRQILVLGSDGNVYGAGEGGSGSLGIGTNVSVTSTPSRYLLPAGVTATGFLKNKSDFQIAGVKGSDGKLYFAGTNQYGRLGNGLTTGVSSTPVAYPLPVGVQGLKVAQTGEGIAVLASDGNVYSSGRNYRGEIGDGTMVQKSTPTRFQLPAGLTATDIMGTYRVLYVLASDGQIYAAGENINGEIGDGTTTPRSTPTRFQLPAGVTVSSFDNALVTENRNFSVLADDGNVYSVGANNYATYDETLGAWVNYAALGTAAPTPAQSVPARYELPAGVTVVKLADARHGRYRVVVGSDGNVYSSGLNDSGRLGDGTYNHSNLPVRFQLPAGLTAVDAWYDAESVLVETNEGSVYAAGCNMGSRCGGMLGVATLGDVATPERVNLPGDFRVARVEGNDYSIFTYLSDDNYAIGGQTYCDVNKNGAQDANESMVNGQQVTLYPAENGVISGPAIATYTTHDYEYDGGVFFFDGLAAGDYVASLTTDSGTFYSSPTTVDGTGDGWILGNSQFFTSASNMGQTGFVCGASTTAPPATPADPSAPAVPSVPSLSNTGFNLYAVIIAVGMALVASMAMVLGYIFRTSARRR